jgi:4-hydroxybenzoate polyprenyltransferase
MIQYIISRFPIDTNKMKALLLLMRPKQWVKNVFVIAPLIFSGAFHQMQSVYLALLAAFYFCVASSATYIVNDLKDIDADRRHPVKSKNRPLASGAVRPTAAIILVILLYAALASAFFILPATLYVIFGYLALNYLYSFGLKHQPVVDIFVIAIGFVLRVLAGAVALNVPLSSWMFVTTLCLALYLASVKRRQELFSSSDKSRKVLEHYNVALVDRYAEMSATGALIFYSLYVMSVQPDLVVTIPIVLFGLFRYWYIVEKLGGGESPTDALYNDWQLVLTVFIWGAISIYVMWN